MLRIHKITIAVVIGLSLGAGFAFAQTSELFAAEGSINDAISHLQKSVDEQRFNSPSLDTKRMRALAYLLLAKSEIQDGLPVPAR